MFELQCPDTLKMTVELHHDFPVRVGADQSQDKPNLLLGEIPWSCPRVMLSGGRPRRRHCCKGMGRRLDGGVLDTNNVSLVPNVLLDIARSRLLLCLLHNRFCAAKIEEWLKVKG